MSIEPLIFAEAARCPRCEQLVQIRQDDRFFIGAGGHVIYERRDLPPLVTRSAPRHGRAWIYTNYGCRCDLCALANGLYARAKRARRASA